MYWNFNAYRIMGIQGLLPLLKDIQRRVSVRDFEGQTVGVDAYCWLHKGAYGCAQDLVEGKDSNVYLNYILRRINMLQNFDIKPILVFDGGYLPAKASKEEERRRNREEYLKKGKAFLRAGNKSQAVDCFQKCVNITPAMATKVIMACRQRNVLCIVAPYEADAQLAYLQKEGITSLTITEDSDLLIYGSTKVLFKMTGDGDGVLIDLADLNKVRSMSFSSFTFEKFRHMCMLSGCDYLPSIKGMGLVKSYKILLKSSDVYRAIKSLRLENSLKVPVDYEKNFRKADAVFMFQSVFDHRKGNIVTLNPVDEATDVSEEDLKYAGPTLSQQKALAIALGNLDPISGEELAQFQDFNVENTDKNASKKSEPKSNSWEPKAIVFPSPKKAKKALNKAPKIKPDEGVYEDDGDSIESLYKITSSTSKVAEQMERSTACLTTRKPDIKRSSKNPFKREDTNDQKPTISKYFGFGSRAEKESKPDRPRIASALDLLSKGQDRCDNHNSVENVERSSPLDTINLNSPSSQVLSQGSTTSDDCDRPRDVTRTPECERTVAIEKDVSRHCHQLEEKDAETSISQETRAHSKVGNDKENYSLVGKRVGLFNQRSLEGTTYIADLLQRFQRNPQKSTPNRNNGVTPIDQRWKRTAIDDMDSCSSPTKKEKAEEERIKCPSPLFKTKVNNLKQTMPVLPRIDLTGPDPQLSTKPGRCKSVGLSKKRKSADTINTSNKKVGQTQLSLQQFSFKRKSISW